MNKLYERRSPDRETTKDLPETQKVLPELPADVTIPDDASGITHPMRAGDGHAASGIRWMRWVPVVLLVAGGVALALALRGDSTDTVTRQPEPWVTITEGPGSNSLDATPMATLTVWTTPTVGPGSNSLDATPMATSTPWTTPTEGPGSNSLDATPMATSTPWTTPTEGPGSNSLDATPMATSTVWTTPTEGPGSNSLAP